MVKRYLTLNPNKAIYEVSAATGVSVDIIYELISQEKLIQKANGIEVNRKLKKVASTKRDVKGVLTDDLDRKGKISDLQSQMNKTPFFKKKDEEKSKLVQDLENLRRGKGLER